MSDAELERIKQARLAQLSQQYGGSIPGSKEEQAAAEEKKRSAEDQRVAMLASVLKPEARERLARIALVKPDKARGVENMLLAMAQRGQLGEQACGLCPLGRASA